MVFDKNSANHARLKGLEVRRGIKLKKAWDEKENIKQLYEAGEWSVAKIAEVYGIHLRSAYRIINDKS